jgi:hypothetical protein
MSSLSESTRVEIESYERVDASRISETTDLNLELVSQNLDQLTNGASSDEFVANG